jgi:electron transfer flavoprotein alpha/beta subunit
MQKPGIGLSDNQVRCAPAWPRKAKQSSRLRVPLVVTVQERNEDPRAEKDRLGHGSDRR